MENHGESLLYEQRYCLDLKKKCCPNNCSGSEMLTRNVSNRTRQIEPFFWNRCHCSTFWPPCDHFLQKVAPCPSMLYSFGMARLCHTTHSLHHVFIQEVWSWHWIQAWFVHVIQQVHPVVVLGSDFPQWFPLGERFSCEAAVALTKQVSQEKSLFFFLGWKHWPLALAPYWNATAQRKRQCSHKPYMVDLFIRCTAIEHSFL